MNQIEVRADLRDKQADQERCGVLALLPAQVAAAAGGTTEQQRRRCQQWRRPAAARRLQRPGAQGPHPNLSGQQRPELLQPNAALCVQQVGLAHGGIQVVRRLRSLEAWIEIEHN